MIQSYFSKLGTSKNLNVRFFKIIIMFYRTETYLCKASRDVSPGVFINCAAAAASTLGFLPPGRRLGLEEAAGKPGKCGIAPVCDKKAAWAAWAACCAACALRAAGWFKAMNWAAIGFNPGGGGPNPLPKGDLSNRGSI